MRKHDENYSREMIAPILSGVLRANTIFDILGGAVFTPPPILYILIDNNGEYLLDNTGIPLMTP